MRESMLAQGHLDMVVSREKQRDQLSVSLRVVLIVVSRTMVGPGGVERRIVLVAKMRGSRCV